MALNSVGSLALLCVACLTIMVGCVIVPGLPAIAAGLGVEGAESWLVTVPALGVVVFGPFVGLLVKGLGARNSLLAGLLFYGVLGAGGACLAGPVPVFTDRFLLGCATAVVMAAGTSLIGEFFEGEVRFKMIARQGMAIELGGVVFLAIGGVLATIGWRYPFAVYLMALVFFAMVLAFVPARTSSDADGAATSAERTSLRSLADIYVAALMSMISFFAAVILLPAKLAELRFDAAQTGYFLSFVSLVAVGAAFFMPAISQSLGSTKTLCLAFAFYALAHLVFYGSAELISNIGGAVALGCGFGLSVPLVNHLVIERSLPSSRGLVLGYLSSAIFLGQFLSAFIDFAPVNGTTSFMAAGCLAIVSIGLLVATQVWVARGMTVISS